MYVAAGERPAISRNRGGLGNSNDQRGCAGAARGGAVKRGPCMSKCARARASMAGLVDGDLGAYEAAYLRGHLDACAECRAALAGFVQVDRELTGSGACVERENP